MGCDVLVSARAKVRSPDGAWDELRRVLQKDVFDVFLRYYQQLESDDAAVPLLGTAR